MERIWGGPSETDLILVLRLEVRPHRFTADTANGLATSMEAVREERRNPQ
jgi:hypothetical protein